MEELFKLLKISIGLEVLQRGFVDGPFLRIKLQESIDFGYYKKIFFHCNIENNNDLLLNIQKKILTIPQNPKNLFNHFYILNINLKDLSFEGYFLYLNDHINK